MPGEKGRHSTEAELAYLAKIGSHAHLPPKGLTEREKAVIEASVKARRVDRLKAYLASTEKRDSWGNLDRHRILTWVKEEIASEEKKYA